MTRLTRELILKADDLPTEVVSVPEWGGDVLVRGLTGTGRDEFEASTMTLRGPAGKQQAVPDTANLRAKLVVRCVIGDDGEPMFTPQDINALGLKSSAALDRVFEVAMRLSGISDNDLEDLGKDSSNGQNDGSTSSSPANLGTPLTTSSGTSVRLS